MTFCGFSGARHTLIGLSSVLCALIMHFVLEEEFVLNALRAVTACKEKSDRYDLTHLLQAIAPERRPHECLSWMSPKTLASAMSSLALPPQPDPQDPRGHCDGVESTDRGGWKTLRMLRPEPKSTPNVVDQGSSSCYADLTPSYRRAARRDLRGRPPAKPLQGNLTCCKQSGEYRGPCTRIAVPKYLTCLYRRSIVIFTT